MSHELNVGIADQEVAAALTSSFEADLKRSQQLRLEEWRRRPLHTKANEKIWSLIGELF